MLWFYLALLSVIGVAIASIFRRIVMRNNTSDAIVFAISFQLIGTLIVGMFAFVHGFVIPPFWKYPLNYLLQAVFWGLATLSLFKASRYLEASETAIITTATSVVTILTAVIFLHDHFGIEYFIGTALIIFSVIYSSYHGKKVKLNKGVFYALAYCLLAGIASTNDAFMIRHADTLSLLTFGFLAPGIFLLLIKPSSIGKMKSFFTPASFLQVFLLTLFYSLSAIAYFLAIHFGGQVSQVFTINESSIIVTLLIATLFLGEKDHLWKKIFCVVLVTIGVVLLS